ncbi:MAG: myxococcus cysteine-rich repeat containing protein [Candidatus Peregrinibacteria bacterium]
MSKIKKYGVIAVLIVSAIAVSFSCRSGLSLPSLPGSSLLGQVGARMNVFSKAKSEQGIVLRKDEHNLFTCAGEGLFPLIVPGSPLERDSVTRYWFYEYTGNEPPLTGRFFISPGEMSAANPGLQQTYVDLLARNGSISEFFRGRTYYIMTSANFTFRCGTGLERAAFCGDGVLHPGEECDDGNTANGDGCSDACFYESLCGNGNLDPGEGCDDGNGTAGDGCSPLCEREAVCGNGIRETGETCDDGNGADEDGCSGLCQHEPGFSCVGSPSVCTPVIPSLGGSGALLPSGNLFVTKDPVPVRSHQLLGGTVVESILRLRFLADGEDVAVTKLFLSASGRAVSIDRLQLLPEGEQQTLAIATIGACGSSPTPSDNSIALGEPVTVFCAEIPGRKLIVPRGETVTLIVQPVLKDDTSGAVSNELIQLFLSTDPIAVEAIGDQSSTLLAANDGDALKEGEVFIGVSSPHTNTAIIGEPHRTVLAKFSNVSNAGTETGSGMTGTANIAGFSFSATPNGTTRNDVHKAVVSDLLFEIEAKNVVMGAQDFVLFNALNPSHPAGCDSLYPDGTTYTDQYIAGSFLVRCSNLTDSLETSVPPADSMRLMLQGFIVNPTASGASPSSLQVSLSHITELPSSQTTFSVSGSHMRWLDRGAGGSQPFLWLDIPDTVIRGTRYSW